MAITGFPAFDRTAAAATLLRARLAEQTARTANGQRAESYAGLGEAARRAVDLRAELARRETLAAAAERGGARAAHAQTVLKRFGDLAVKIANSAETLTGLDARHAATIATSARAALAEVGSLLNERFEGEAVFGGADLDGAPVPAPIEDSGLHRAIGDAIAGMAPGGGAALRAGLRALSAGNDPALSPFSAHAVAAARGERADPRRAVVVEDGVTVAIGLHPNRNAAAPPSTAADSTGSWARDIIHGLSVLAQLGDREAAMGEDFRQLTAGAIGALRAGIIGVNQEAGGLGAAEERLDAAAKRHREVGGQVTLQLASVEEVDLAEAISAAQATRTRLEASYRSLAMLSELSLTKFLR